MLLPALSFIYAIAVHRYLPFFPLSVTILSIFLTLILYKRIRRESLIIISIFFFGLLYSYIREADIPDIIPPDGEVLLTGTIIDVPEVNNDRLGFTVDDVFIDDERIDGMVRLSIDIEEGQPPIRSGDIVNATVSLKGITTFRNPGVYSYDPRQDGVIARGNVSQIEIISSKNNLWHIVNRTRQRLGWIMDRSLSHNSASFLKAIIIGLRRGISQDIIDDFNSTGLAHLLSISGTHFGLLAFIVFKVVRMCARLLPLRILNRLTLYLSLTQLSVLLTMPILILYVGLSGMSIPAVRSFIMVFIYMTALFIGRKGQWLNSLSIAAIIILLWNPQALFDVSFQLSFLAVLSIGIVLERINERDEDEMSIINKVFNKIKTAGLITISALLGTSPLIILFFKNLSLISPITNLIITPLICFIILPIGFLSAFISVLFNIPYLPLNQPIDSIISFTLNLISSSADIPYASIRLPNPSFLIIALYFISMILILFSNNRLRFIPILSVILIFLMRPYIHTDDMRVTFLDVGQGDSSVIELPDGKVMLIDGGSDVNDSGRRVIAPYLWSKGIRDIDIVVLTHAHPDHYGGLIYILDNFNIKRIWLNGRFVKGSETFFDKLTKKSMTTRIVKRGDSFKGDGYQITILHPYDIFSADSQRGAFSNENDDSIVLKIERNDFSVLFTGDIEMEAEDDLIHLGSWLRSRIIKVPHHGGRTSSSEDFIRLVNPEIAIISVGKYNIYNHPHPETLDRYLSRGIRIYRTDDDGAVTIILNDNRYSIMTYEDSRFKRIGNIYDEFRNLRLLL